MSSTCPKCKTWCPANEMAAYGRHEDCAMTEATVSIGRKITADQMAKRGPYRKRKPQKPPAESED